MSTPVDQDAWHDLIERFIAQKRRLLKTGELEDDTHPNPGATQAQLIAAEQRLGRRLDPQYRGLLSVADGWDCFYLGFSLLGTADISMGPRWESGLAHAQIWFEDDEWGEEIGAPNDSAVYQPLVTSDNGYSGTVFLFVGKSDTLPTGAAVPLPPDNTYPDLYSYLATELDMITNFAW
ncbi:SMI1/KNR4 family protein [Nocardia otitidiscaviarum]|uniref:SMI1/KNR4 family protein n=1 Tax=Nocardia otitidiscaviarum TaxID=1823 RepID=UPI0018935E32|nr:SMI1/KNR4 family protein [Nocardia otitidiscaviarum]MBF6180380.1 SMI1/KNR4 family protein [Nocardia otitidiscaviarum]